MGRARWTPSWDVKGATFAEPVIRGCIEHGLFDENHTTRSAHWDSTQCPRDHGLMSLKDALRFPLTCGRLLLDDIV